MQENGRPRSGSTALAGADALVRGAVLVTILRSYPERRTVGMLATEINQVTDLPSPDVVERAVRDLVGDGLLRCRGGAVLPTRSAAFLFGLRGW